MDSGKLVLYRWTEGTLTPVRPDHCAGGFDQFCDSRRKYSNISLIIVDLGRGDLLEYMSEYWKDFRGDDSNLWQHEWNKHGTCVSTLETHCYEDYIPQQEVVDYFDRTVEVFKDLPTHEVSFALYNTTAIKRLILSSSWPIMELYHHKHRPTLSPTLKVH
jgi:hypothetical protein